MTVVTLGGLTVDQVNPLPVIKNRLAGRVKVNGSGAKKRIAVFRRGTLEYVASGMSNADGTWEIKGLPEISGEAFFVVYLDDTRSFDPVAFDNIALET